MTWRNLKTNPPKEDCYICVAFREENEMTGYMTFSYEAASGVITESGHRYDTKRATCELLYINLNEITLG